MKKIVKALLISGLFKSQKDLKEGERGKKKDTS